MILVTILSDLPQREDGLIASVLQVNRIVQPADPGEFSFYLGRQRRFPVRRNNCYFSDGLLNGRTGQGRRGCGEVLESGEGPAAGLIEEGVQINSAGGGLLRVRRTYFRV